MALKMFDNEKFKEFYLLEKHRIDSFEYWPYDDTVPCSITKMAEAGFYWTGNRRENDTATCFVCKKTLDGWEANDDPWKEHLKHAPQCDFVKYHCVERDLTVEQFLRIVAVVVKNEIKTDVVKARASLEKKCEKELQSFTKK